ncbi:MAG: hypothetical protein PWQ89_1493 [Verrucomicrobiota bacterium]|nr:hypothetical protein [Verrucomicrobiota bacterium]
MESVAITFGNSDCFRIIPMHGNHDRVELKFSLRSNKYLVRKFELDQSIGGQMYKPHDFGEMSHEISYHNSNINHKSPTLLPKEKENKSRNPISNRIIDLNLKNVIVPIPVCRITVAKPAAAKYREKKYHHIVELTPEFNSVDIYIASEKFDLEKRGMEFPLIAGTIFPITTIDYLLYGAGAGCIPIYDKMNRSREPVVGLESNLVGGVRFFFKVYSVCSTNKYFVTSNPEYDAMNILEFYDNIDYLSLLANTPISFVHSNQRPTGPRPAFELDFEYQTRQGNEFRHMSRFRKKFQKVKSRYLRLKKDLPAGMILPV